MLNDAGETNPKKVFSLDLENSRIKTIGALDKVCLFT